MKLEKKHIEKIKTAFDKMQNKEDLLHLLNEARVLIYGNQNYLFNLKQLNWYANSKLEGNRYIEFKIKKKSGTDRCIHAPIKGLKSLQKVLAFILQCVYKPHNAATGFIKNKSIVENAKLHINSRYVYNIDLKDFFSSIEQGRVRACLQLKPFNLNSKTINIERLNIAYIIASLCCTRIEVERKNNAGEWQKEICNVLPQGAPTSPIITNIVCQRLDYLLTGVANRFGLRYSRYADDITFSSMHNVYKPESDFIKELNRIITEQGFHIKENKTRLQKNGYRKEVTGLLVNEKVNVQQRYIKQLRMWLYYWERYGHEKAYSYFLQQYITDKGHIKKGKPDMRNVIAGKLDYLRMIKEPHNKLYLKLKKRFDILINKCELVVENNSLLNKKQKVKNDRITTDMDIPINHSPNKLVLILKKFSLNDSVLKYATHSWDTDMLKNIPYFLEKAKKEYDDFEEELKVLSPNLRAKIYAFLFNKKVSDEGWGLHRIKFGWSSPEINQACNETPGIKPEDIILPKKYQITISGKTIQKFKHVIDLFKNEIEIRDENSALRQLILDKHDEYLGDFNIIEINNLENKTFYTDVQWLSTILDYIFEAIKQRSENKGISYSVIDRSDAYILEILHIDSYNTGKSIYDEKLKLRKGDFGTIVDKLKNICDWSIESTFKEGSYRINYLVSDKNKKNHEQIETAKGFKYILTFYK